MKVEDIVKIIEALGKTHLTEFHLEGQGFTLKMGKGNTNYTPLEVEKIGAKDETPKMEESKVDITSDTLLKVVSPMVGTFYEAPSPDAGPFVKVGDVVQNGDTLCIIEAMKLMNEIESTENGKIVKILVENGELVEYGQTLFLIEPV